MRIASSGNDHPRERLILFGRPHHCGGDATQGDTAGTQIDLAGGHRAGQANAQLLPGLPAPLRMPIFSSRFTSTPWRFMMIHCWVIESVLFHDQ
jgi:hypothetical protein